jgi:hypothetical protein
MVNFGKKLMVDQVEEWKGYDFSFGPIYPTNDICLYCFSTYKLCFKFNLREGISTYILS